jgi:hypothetical protein
MSRVNSLTCCVQLRQTPLQKSFASLSSAVTEEVYALLTGYGKTRPFSPLHFAPVFEFGWYAMSPWDKLEFGHLESP